LWEKALPIVLNTPIKKNEPSYIVSGNVNLCNHYGKQYRDSSKKKKLKVQQHMIMLYATCGLEGNAVEYDRDPCTHVP
jgi:predicted GNAT family N-acyltransferase